MKLTTIQHFLLLFCICSLYTTQSIKACLSVSQYKPDSFFQKPYFNQDDYCSIATIFSGGHTDQAFNNQGNKVPYLEQFGPENLRMALIDPFTQNPTQSFGQGYLQGKEHVQELILNCYKNMKAGFFIEGTIVIQNLTINNITINFTPNTMPTDEQIADLATLQSQLPRTIGQSGMYTTCYYAGYSTTFANFTHLDFIDLTVKTGLYSPQAMLSNTSNLLQLPFVPNFNFGYPIIATASLGLLDWITLGVNGSIIPWQSATKTIPMPTIATADNNLLGLTSGLAQIEKGPLLTAAIYFEADHFHHGLSATVGYAFNKNYGGTIKPFNQEQFPTQLVNQANIFQPWSNGSMFLQFDIDFANHAQPSAPIISVFYNVPIAGKLCSKTNMLGGSCNLQISYLF